MISNETMTLDDARSILEELEIDFDGWHAIYLSDFPMEGEPENERLAVAVTETFIMMTCIRLSESAEMSAEEVYDQMFADRDISLRIHTDPNGNRVYELVADAAEATEDES